ncbi:GTP binding domain-containing protein [Cinnamomum micranthum f. kanehirae]|uniref:GTPase Der n=1 Tax=Cinnamomum micranthum f. kanehirae TaxID=337451 RepID=A0A3S3MZ40_9MAGN|nr:GTP binding domain-containing protein [Cinnamomum micranthum f. kanehirae]
MARSWVRLLLSRRHNGFGICHSLPIKRKIMNGILAEKEVMNPLANHLGSLSATRIAFINRPCTCTGTVMGLKSRFISPLLRYLSTEGFSGVERVDPDLGIPNTDSSIVEDALLDSHENCGPHDDFSKSSISADVTDVDEPKVKGNRKKLKSAVEFSKVDVELLPTIILVGRPNVGKSALFNRLIRRREALVYNTPDDHVTRDVREGIAKLSDLRFKVLDSAGLEMAATSGSILSRTAEMTGNVLARSNFAIFLIDARDGLQPLDLEVGKWLRKHASGIKTILVLNKSESLEDETGSLTAATGEAHSLGFGDPIAISAETGLGMVYLYEVLRPLLEDYMLPILNDKLSHDDSSLEVEETKLPLQLAIVGRPNVGKSTLLNAILQQDRVMVGPEAGLTRDSIRTQIQFQGRTVYLVDTAGWLQRTGQEKGPGSLSVMQSRKSLMRAHVIALVLDAEEIAKAKSSMKHAEMVIARQAVEEGRGLVVIVNKMDLLRGKQNAKLYEKVMKIVPEEIQTVIPQVTGVPVVFVSALEGKGRIAVMRQVVDTYEKWCLRLPTARLNRWLRKVMSRHSWKDQAAKPKIKYFTQVKARPPTFVAFLSGKTQLLETDIRFLMKSLKEDFDMGGIPIRIMQRSVPKKAGNNNSVKNPSARVHLRVGSDKRTTTSRLPAA